METIKTIEDLIEETTRIKDGAKGEIYFLNRYAKITHPTKGLISFKLYDFQKQIIRDFWSYRHNIHNKSRQMGDSTIVAGHVAHFVMFNNDKDVLILSNKQRNAQKFLRKVKRIIKATPEILRPEVMSDNKTSLELSNGSNVEAVATTEDAGRSDALSLLVVDEAAQIKSELADEIWTSAGSTLAQGGAAIILSTPRGIGNFFHQMCISARDMENEFHYEFYHWSLHPVFNQGMEHDLTGKLTSPWYRGECKRLNNSETKIAQELDGEFLSSGDNVISEKVMKLHEDNIRPPKLTAFINDNLWVWREPEKEMRYIIGADVSRGDAADFSTAQVLSLDEKNEQCAEYRGKIPPDVFGDFLITLGKEYNNALIIPDSNGIGYATALRLVEKKYPNIHFSESFKKTHEQFTNYYKEGGKIPGFQTTSVTRPLIISQFEADMRNQNVLMHSSRLFDEIPTFQYINGRPDHLPGYQDDLIMAMSIALFIRATHVKAIINSREMTESILASFSKDDGNTLDDYGLGVSKGFGERTNPFITPDGQDVRWLLGK